MNKRFYNLDIIKVIAAILIVFHHYQQMAQVKFNGINFYDGSFYWGNLVELFFLISGFVMAVSNREEENIFRKFWGKCIRIYPSTTLACSAVILIVLAGRILLGEEISHPVDYSSPIVLIANYMLIFSGWFLSVGLGINNPTWYLCVLLLCYILYYGIEVISRKTRINQNVFYVMIVLFSCVSKYFENTFPLFFTWQDQRGYICFFLGVLLYELAVKRLTKKQIWLVALGFAALTGLGVRRWGIGSPFVLSLFFYPFLILFAVNIRQVSHPLLNTAGGVSFQVYLWHVPCFLFLKVVGKAVGIQITHSYFTMIVFTVFVEIVSLFIYKYYEKPVAKWLRQLEMKLCGILQ